MRMQRTSGSPLISWQWIVAVGLVALAIVVTLAGQVRFASGVSSGSASLAPAERAPAAPLNFGTGSVYDGQPYGEVAAPSRPANYGTGYYDAYASEAARKAAQAPAAPLNFGTGSVYQEQP
ncbi:MAG TPA: hypothetical protein VNL77_24075 [Roseiflexaceae bacterium]|nr:hypothetical protein [Roseiflexaceae bacterium]